jgi:hypothetical protein
VYLHTCEKHLLALSCLPACIKWSYIGCIFVKFYIGDFIKICQENPDLAKIRENLGHFI